VPCPEHAASCFASECAPSVLLAVGAAHVCAQPSEAGIRCWGDNQYGQLGLGDLNARGKSLPTSDRRELEPIRFFPGRAAKVLAAGGAHTCAVFADDDSLVCWGHNGNGQLGLGDRAQRGDSLRLALAPVDLGKGRKAIAVALGARHSCVVLEGGRVKCWGANAFGQLGLGDAEQRGDEPGDMGDALPELRLGDSLAVVQLAAGGYFTCALLSNGRVKCWGNNDYGQLGANVSSPRGDATGEMGEALPFVPFSRNQRVLAVTAGYAHACALLDDGSVECWGGGGSARLGSNRPAALGHLPLAVDNEHGGAALAVSAGASHSCMLRDDRRIQCWGSNWAGELGLGSSTATFAKDSEPADLGSEAGVPILATALSASHNFTCATFDAGQVKCWGLNVSGQLGAFDTENRGDEATEMGNSLPTVPLGPLDALTR
jgi:alpha-tubulin suppressor-like RCC1 family protein